MQKWEYYVLRWAPGMGGPLETFLEDRGQEGWELVSTTTRDHDSPGAITLIFKRPRS